jgi:hypothetical protein
MTQAESHHDYLVLSRGQWDEHASPEDVQGAIDSFYAWYDRNIALGRMRPGSRLAREGKFISKASTSDGPFTETKEVIGGFWFIVASSLEEAAALAEENPCLAFGLTLEVRPLDPVRATAAAIASETPRVWRAR